MLDVNDYGVTALDQGALTEISGGDGGCEELAYAIGYGIGFMAHTLWEAVQSPNPIFTLATGM